MAVTERWRAFLEENHYVRLVNDASLFGLGHEAGAFDVAIADAVFPFRPFNAVARCIASVVRRLEPSGRFYATWFENPDPANFEPIVQPNGVTSFPDSEPYHYPFALIANVCEAVGATVERVREHRASRRRVAAGHRTPGRSLNCRLVDATATRR